MNYYHFKKPMKVKSIIDLVSKKRIIDMRQMIENDWKVEVSFFHRLTGIGIYRKITPDKNG
ncbi:hypothetical protein PI85_13925 [Lysinibacillus sp. A1]|nr:hypothetical protein HR49_04840 [Lysinibacillus fusiformis]KHK51465.1 hypothetical protein PI85_13925 [Lysinibacillus sp. A1]